MEKDKHSATTKGTLLTKMECCNLFCSRLGIGRDSYYKYFRPHIKFRHYAKIQKQGQTEGRLARIPYEVAVGLINLLREEPASGDPPREKLLEFMHTKGELSENSRKPISRS